jgi:hypothetical protein
MNIQQPCCLEVFRGCHKLDVHQTALSFETFLGGIGQRYCGDLTEQLTRCLSDSPVVCKFLIYHDENKKMSFETRERMHCNQEGEYDA